MEAPPERETPQLTEEESFDPVLLEATAGIITPAEWEALLAHQDIAHEAFTAHTNGSPYNPELLGEIARRLEIADRISESDRVFVEKSVRFHLAEDRERAELRRRAEKVTMPDYWAAVDGVYAALSTSRRVKLSSRAIWTETLRDTIATIEEELRAEYFALPGEVPFVAAKVLVASPPRYHEFARKLTERYVNLSTRLVENEKLIEEFELPAPLPVRALHLPDDQLKSFLRLVTIEAALGYHEETTKARQWQERAAAKKSQAAALKP